MPQNPDDHDDFAAALSFPVAGQADTDYDSDDASAALGFAVESDSVEHSAVDVSHEYAPAEHEDTEIELDTIHSQTEETGSEEEGNGLTLFTVTNPPGTVSVSALGDGGIEKISLSEKVASMTESQLAEEILVVAHLAGQKGQAAQHEFLFENMRDLGADDTGALHDLLENGMQLTSPEQAAETQAQVFATRYATDH